MKDLIKVEAFSLTLRPIFTFEKFQFGHRWQCQTDKLTLSFIRVCLRQFRTSRALTECCLGTSVLIDAKGTVEGAMQRLVKTVL